MVLPSINAAPSIVWIAPPKAVAVLLRRELRQVSLRGGLHFAERVFLLL